MIYIKYTWKTDPNIWFIRVHEKGSKIETQIFDFNGNTHRYFQYKLDLKLRHKYCKIKYLTKKEIDLLKLELL